MKIVFICVSLEPGRDGVGDYTRRLASECIRRGHECRIVALNDRHLTSTDGVEEGQTDEGTSVPCLRWSGTLSWHQRIEGTRAWLADFQPDCGSLQYVPYGYQLRGLPWRLAGHLRSLKMPAWHLMFHELCVGLGSRPPLKHRLLGQWQLQVVKRLLHILKPIQVHTQCIPYQALLQTWIAQPGHLPLFSSISRASTNCTDDSAVIWAAYFGSVHSGWNVGTTAKQLKNVKRRLGREVHLLAIGNGGPCATSTWALFRQSGIPVLETGSIDAYHVSKALSRCRFGLSASCPDLIEKSSAAAAMIEHGLPILVTRPPIWGQQYLDEVRHQCPWLVMDEEQLFIQLQSKSSYSAPTVDKVTRKFLNDIVTERSKAQ
jgi:hypothetical protein